MLETGVRFEAVYEALKRENYALAEYHWEKIRTTNPERVPQQAETPG